MKTLITRLIAFIISLLVFSAAIAHDLNEHQITTLLKKMFEKPDAPLTVTSVSVEGNSAVAGWIQGERGGRAFLQKEHGQWSIAICGGTGLTKAEVLQSVGLSNAEAARLAESIGRKEDSLDPTKRRLLDGFEGMMRVGNGLAHDGHPTHTDQK